ncbi:MAG: hypothetical protein RLZZ53_1086, partial [Acidobacteriota bacterium]
MAYGRSVAVAALFAACSSGAVAQSGWPGVAAWGSNNYGQCNAPADLGTPVSIAGGAFHTVALKADGSVVCWGDNGPGQCNVPAGLGTVSAVAAGYYHTVALKSDGSVACWGNNGYGQCNVPADLGAAIAIAAGFDHTVALRADGSVRCWGYNDYGQCNVPPELGSCAAIASGRFHTIALSVRGSARCWGLNNHGQCSTPTDLGTTSAIAGGGNHTIALGTAGSVRCWGNNGNGQCNVPMDLGAATAVAGGYSHTIALRADGSVRCWGHNYFGQCNVPADLGAAIAIAGGYDHTIALRADGSVRCWGYNHFGQCNVPADLGPCIAIASGSDHCIAFNPNHPVRVVDGDGSQKNAYGSINYASQFSAGTDAIEFTENATRPVNVWNEQLRGIANANIQGDFRFYTSTLSVLQSMGVTGDFKLGSVGSPSTAQINGSLNAGSLTGAGTASIGGDATLATLNLESSTASLVAQGSLNTGTVWGQGTVTVGGSMTIGQFSKYGLTRAAGNISVTGNASLSSATLSAGEKSTILGNLNSEPNSVISSDLVTDVASVIDIHRVVSTGIRTAAPSPTRVTMPIDLAIGNYYPYDISTTHRLILDGGVYSSNPIGETDTAVFNTCTAPEFAAVTPCLEFGPNSVIDLPPGNKIINHGPTTTLIGGLATLRNGSSIETDADLAIAGSMRIPVGTAVSLSVDRVTPADPALDIRAGGELVVEFGSSVQIAAPAKASVSGGSLTVDTDALFSLLGGADLLQVEPTGDARCFGGTIRADEMILRGAPVGSTNPGGRLVGVGALIDVDTVRVR